jgi:hypothetical protein
VGETLSVTELFIRTAAPTRTELIEKESRTIISDYSTWVDQVFDNICDILGGDRNQTGSDRAFADGRFSHSGPKDGFGDVTFSVMLPDEPSRPRILCGPFEWRAYPDPLVVCRQIVAAYHDLKAI